MREHKKKWLFDKGKTSGSKKQWSYGGDFSDDRNTKQPKNIEDAPKKSSMKTGKVFNNRLSFSPLRRFLKTKVGKNWDEIYSEIKERIPKDVWETHRPDTFYVSSKVEIQSDGSIIDMKVRSFYVSRGVISEDGKTCKYGNYSHYYVHPETNLLCRLEPTISSGRKGKPKLTKKEGKKKHAKIKTERNKYKSSRKKGGKINADKAAQVMKEKKKDDVQKG